MSSQGHSQQICFHCGDQVFSALNHDNKVFCCQGCKTVYSILSTSGLENYYSLEKNPGITPSAAKTYYEFLDNEEIQRNLLQYKDEKKAIVTLEIPAIHCSSCIWLLEHLNRLHGGVISSEVNFVRKTVRITYHPGEITLRELGELLSKIGYPAALSFDKVGKKTTSSHKSQERSLLFKLGIAGFAFGNIMLLAFPEYLDSFNNIEQKYRELFSWTALLLSLPVVFYSGKDFLVSAWKSLSNKYVNIDVPIALGILTLFIFSIAEVFSGNGSGYLDSLSGLIFFLLIGKFFQERTYSALSFDRDFKSFFPVAVTRIVGNEKESTLLDNLEKGDTLFIRHGEIIPVDARLLDDATTLDYSFITGESDPVRRNKGEFIYAGAKQTGPAVKIEVLKKLKDSELLGLWNSSGKNPVESDMKKISSRVSKYFTFIILLISFAAFFFWLPQDMEKAIRVFAAVLIIACPCALALSTPFTYGSVMRKFANAKFFIKDSHVVEDMARITDLVFDKTGTLTAPGHAEVEYDGIMLSEEEEKAVYSVASNSLHDISKKISLKLNSRQAMPIHEFEEFPGDGIIGRVNGLEIGIGKQSFLHSRFPGNSGLAVNDLPGAYISIDGRLKGKFSLRNKYREGISEWIGQLKQGYSLHVLSGDNDNERPALEQIFGSGTPQSFRNSPLEKEKYIKTLNGQGRFPAMIGDGLNDAGALKSSKLGISITDDSSLFTPAADAILLGRSLPLLPAFFALAKKARRIIYASFALSFLYNIVGITLAVQGILNPVAAAILMPLSSITVVAFTTLAVHLAAAKIKTN